MRFSKNITASSRRPHGFTIVELLVVIGILVILAGLTASMAVRGQRKARQVRVQSDLQGIAMALDAYKQDFGDYPRLAEARIALNPTQLDSSAAGSALMTGSELLCWALASPYPEKLSGDFAPGDGASGPGFRVRATPLGVPTKGLVYGPYLNIDTYKFGRDATTPRFQVLKDYYGNPILYFAARNPRPNISLKFAGDDKTFLYDFRENESSFYRDQAGFTDGAQAFARFQVVLGDSGFGPPVTAGDGKINGSETPVNQGPYVLWSAGADGKFGPDDPTLPADVKKCDDLLVPTN